MIELLHANDRGVLDKERLVFKATKNGDIGSLMIFQTKLFENDHVSARPKSTFWFPDKEIKIGDLVIVYSKPGTESVKKNEDDKTESHFFYWGAKQPMWKNKDDCPVLAELKDWSILKLD